MAQPGAAAASWWVALQMPGLLCPVPLKAQGTILAVLAARSCAPFMLIDVHNCCTCNNPQGKTNKNNGIKRQGEAKSGPAQPHRIKKNGHYVAIGNCKAHNQKHAGEKE